MKTKQLLCTLGAMAALPVISFAQTAAETASPTSSADGGAQKTMTQDDSIKKEIPATPTTDAAHLSPTNTQTGGAVDTGTPKDNVDKNSNVEHATSTESSPR